MKNKIKTLLVKFDMDGIEDYPSLANNRGWGNGYIGVPKTHECFGLGYDDDQFREFCENNSIYAHGGFTYAEQWNPKLREVDDDYWWFGFDTAHGGDSVEEWSEAKVKSHTNKLANKFITLEHKLDMMSL